MYTKIAAMALLVCVVGCQFFNPIAPIVQLGIYWKEGEATKYYAVNQDELATATKKALAKFTLPIISESEKDRTISIKAGDDDKFKIKVIAVRDNVSKLCIRVNTFGDRPYAELLYRFIDEQPEVKQFTSVASLNNAIERQHRPRR